jgi:hypothetical protein
MDHSQIHRSTNATGLGAKLAWKSVGGKLKTIWSYALHTEAHNIPEDKNANMMYVALGTELTLGKFVIAYDFKLRMKTWIELRLLVTQFRIIFILIPCRMLNI